MGPEDKICFGKMTGGKTVEKERMGGKEMGATSADKMFQEGYLHREGKGAGLSQE